MRFPEFKDEWKICTISDFGKIITGSTPSTKDTSLYGEEYLWASPSDLGTNKFVTETNTKLSQKGFEKSRKLPKDSILVTCIGSTIGKMGMASRDMATNQQINAIIVNKDVDCHFAYYAIQSSFPRYMLSVAVQAVPIISKSNFEKLCNYRPTTEEQKKIGALLSLIDKRIEIQKSVIEKLKSLMAGICSILLNPKDAQQIPVKNFLVERIEKTTVNNQYEVLSSTIKGLFSQKEYFSKEIASENNIGYKIIRKEDVVLSPQNLYMGNINFNDKFEVGIVSPSYKIYSISDDFNKTYVSNVLRTHRALFKYMLISEQGASIVRRNLNIEDFEKLKFPFPTRDEQDKTANKITAINHKIELENSILMDLMLQKSYLLSKMFI